MNSKSFVIAMGLICCLGVWVAAQPAASGPAADPRRPAWATEVAGATSKSTARPQKELTEQRVQELLDRTKAHSPQMFARLTELRESYPGRFQQSIESLDRLVRQVDALSPEMRETFWHIRAAEVRAAELGARYRATSSEPERAALRGELRRVIERQFDDLQVLQADQLEQLSSRVEALRLKQAERARNREKIVEDRLKSLLESKQPGWQP